MNGVGPVVFGDLPAGGQRRFEAKTASIDVNEIRRQKSRDGRVRNARRKQPVEGFRVFADRCDEIATSSAGQIVAHEEGGRFHLHGRRLGEYRWQRQQENQRASEGLGFCSHARSLLKNEPGVKC